MPHTCPCDTCSFYPDDREDTGNGFYIVHCTDNITRCANYDEGCAFYTPNEWVGITDVQ